jgi:tripartite-type tricarboxylate transporter receptor subunit TctC
VRLFLPFFVSTLAFGQAYPTRAVTFIVPFPPGGGTDISARTVAAKLTQKWGQSVVAEADLARYGRITREQGPKAE